MLLISPQCLFLSDLNFFSDPVHCHIAVEI